MKKNICHKKPWNLFFWSYFSCRVICVFHGKKLRERRKGTKLIFDGGDSVIWRILPKTDGHGVKLGIVASAPRKTERGMVEVGEYITWLIFQIREIYSLLGARNSPRLLSTIPAQWSYYSIGSPSFRGILKKTAGHGISPSSAVWGQFRGKLVIFLT